LQIYGAGRKSRKRPTLVVGKKPYGKCQFRPSQTEFVLTSLQGATDENIEAMRNAISSGGSVIVSIYSPEVNPITGKVIGPSPVGAYSFYVGDTKLKGTASLSFQGDKIYISTLIELAPIVAGDTVSAFRDKNDTWIGDQWKLWGVLINGKMPNESRPVSSTTNNPSTNNLVTVLATLQETSTNAQAGDAEAQFILGKAYLSGQGMDKNYAEAAKWFRKGADQGNEDAQNGLGVMYNSGLGVNQNYAEAFKLFQLAAAQGSAKAQVNLGLAYEKAQGVDKNYAEAVNWYRKAAEQGNVMGQAHLGLMYNNGWGVDKDNVEAKKWFQKAAAQGDEFSKRALQQLSNGQ
jgi:hypothetical protein